MNRASLSETLHTLCENVYYQPTINTEMAYPCIVYTLNTVNTDYADNQTYKNMREYTLQYITSNPDPRDEETMEGMIETILGTFSYIRHVNHFTKDNLHHDNFILHY